MAYFTIFASRNYIEGIDVLVREVFEEKYKVNGTPGEIVAQSKGWFSKNKITIRVVSEDTDPEYFENNIPGMMGFYQQIPFADDDLKYRVMTQISVMNTMLAIETDKDYGEDELRLFIELTGKVDGIGFLRDGTLLDYDGRVIVAADGQSGPADFKPRACTRKIRGEGEGRSTEEGLARKERTHAYLQDKGIPFHKGLPELPPLTDVSVRSPEEIARRAVALLIVIQYACDVAQEGDLRESKEFVLSMLERFGITDELTEKERELLDPEEPGQQDAVNLVWQYEAYWALLWGLGLVEELDFPADTCDCDFAIHAVSSCETFEAFLGKTARRKPEELLEEADEIYRLHWACVNARINGQAAPASLNESVVMERRRGLFWMLGIGDDEWDHIRMDT